MAGALNFDGLLEAKTPEENVTRAEKESQAAGLFYNRAEARSTLPFFDTITMYEIKERPARLATLVTDAMGNCRLCDR